MTMTKDVVSEWPKIPRLADWEPTLTTVHMWTQIVGKIRLGLAPHINHSWGSTLYVSSRGLTTSAIPWGDGSFTIDFDFVGHTLFITRSSGASVSFSLEPMSVAEFYQKMMHGLDDLGIHVKILARPVEVVEATPFAEDRQHASYDPIAMHGYWRALVVVNAVWVGVSRQASSENGPCRSSGRVRLGGDPVFRQNGAQASGRSPELRGLGDG